MNLLRALATVSSMTLLSRILGFARDFFIARAFGAGLATDAFFVAFRIPNLLRRLFAEGAFSQAFVPVLSEYRNRSSPEETRGLVDAVFTYINRGVPKSTRQKNGYGNVRALSTRVLYQVAGERQLSNVEVLTAHCTKEHFLWT